MINSLVHSFFRSLGYSIHERKWIEYLEQPRCSWVSPGHFFSPYQNQDEIRRNEKAIFDHHRPILWIDLREKEQIQILEAIRTLYPSMQFPQAKDSRFRYYFDNGAYAYSDGIVLHGAGSGIFLSSVFVIGQFIIERYAQ